MKKYKIVYMGSCRGHTAGELYEEEISEEEYMRLTDEDMQEHKRNAQETADDHFGVIGRVEIIGVDDE